MTQYTPSTRTRAPHQWLAVTIGAVYLVVGIAGFFVTGFSGFAEHDHGQTLLGFAVNPLHNIVHIVIGLLGLALWSTPGRARTFGWLLAVGYGVTFVFGLFAVNNPGINIININAADNVLHVLSALAGLAIALWPARSTTTAASHA
ncbi:DUF4383 domain-containing protein [Promicromonospora sp. NPDC050880]|uniref:DUF4383 domain-containing protein n=1 Tax=Promicromonospora sp. NPDC050880 TaxID=3364406 RepID=UPI00379A49E1